jgi:phage-related protein (TIGR01555 family)
MPELQQRRRIRAGTNPDMERQAQLQRMGFGQGFDAQAFDYFSNVPARMGYGTPNLAEAATYELDRLSFNYWLLITLYRNHWISRRIVDTPAQDMVRAWPKLTSDIPPEDLTKIDRKIRRTQTKSTLLRALKWARLFGGGGALMVIDGQEDNLEEPLDPDTIGVGDYKGLIPFDRWTGIQPHGDICTDINRPTDFNKPEMYRVTAPDAESFLVHSSRILRFSGPEVPTPEYEAQTYWGISVIEPAYEEIRKRDNMSWNILSLTFRACILGMKFPELAKVLSGVGMNQQAAIQFQQRMTTLNHLLSNQSLVPLPADGGIEAVNYTFTGLSDVYQQFQLDISGATQIPVTRLWGRTISGLGQSNDADERIYEEKIATDQDVELRPQLEKLYPVLCMSELGEIPDDLDLNFPSVRVLDEKEKSELAKATLDTVAVAINLGIMSPRAGAEEVKQASDATGFGTNLTDERIAALSDDVMSMGEQGGGEGGLESLTGEGGEEEGQGSKGESGKEPGGDPEGEQDDKRLATMQKLFGPQRAEKRALSAVARATDDSKASKKAWERRRKGMGPREEPGGGEGSSDPDKESTGGSGGEESTKTAHLQSYSSREDWPEHAKSLKIPPAWKDVRISPMPKADLLATGLDSKGRKQYVYSPTFKNSQADLKFQRVQALQKNMSLIDKQLDGFRKSKDAKVRDHADCMYLVRKTGIRPGSDSDTGGAVKAYGASTLQGHHVWQLGNSVRLRFVGKKGVTISLPVEDAQLGSMLKELRAKAGEKGNLFPSVSDASLRDFTKDNLDHGGFKTKDFRTALAAETANGLVEKVKAPTNPKEYKKAVMEVAKAVSEKLGNTPIVALQSYIPPQIFSGWKSASEGSAEPARAGDTKLNFFKEAFDKAFGVELPEVHYGSAQRTDDDWRQYEGDFDDVDDDAELERTPRSVIDMLGFDPLEMDEPGRAADADDPGVMEFNIHGLTCVVETPKGHIRSGKGWSVRMPAHYGYIEGFTGADGDSLDCYIGPDPESDWVYIVDQRHLHTSKGFDEHKVFLGFDTLGEVKRAYPKAHHRADEVMMDISPMQIDDFKYWLATANLNRPAGAVKA